MIFQRLKTPGLGHNAYLIGCGDGQAVVVDPRRDVDEYIRLARENDLSIAYVLETHRQEDFEFGSRELARLTGAEVVGLDHELFGAIDRRLADGEELKVGSTRFVALSTPGHTPESTSYACYASDSGEACWAVFTGDTLFVGDTGRTDLTDAARTGEHAGQLWDSVHAKLAPLGPQALLYPAHGSGSACGGNISSRDESTLGIEQATNPVFTKSREAFIEHKLAEKMARPPYFRHMEEVNLQGGRPMPGLAGVPVLQPKQFQARIAGARVVDTRPPEAFAGAHIAGSYNLWTEGVPAFGGWIASAGDPIYLVVDGTSDLEQALRSFARIGIDSVEGVLLDGVEGWREQGLPIETLQTTSAQEAAAWREQGRAQVLDVRDQYEWDEKHIPGAIHQYVGELEQHLERVPKDRDLVVHCSVGHRSGLAVSILRRNGYHRIWNLLGGITAWSQLGLALEKPN